MWKGKVEGRGGKGDLGKRGGVIRQLQSRDYGKRNVNGWQGKRGGNK